MPNTLICIVTMNEEPWLDPDFIAPDPERSVFDLASFGDRSEFSTYLNDSELDINIMDEQGRSLLCNAAMFGNYGCVRELVERGADLDLYDPNRGGEPAVLLSYVNGYTEVANYLIESGADIRRPGNMGISLEDKIVATKGGERPADLE